MSTKKQTNSANDQFYYADKKSLVIVLGIFFVLISAPVIWLFEQSRAQRDLSSQQIRHEETHFIPMDESSYLEEMLEQDLPPLDREIFPAVEKDAVLFIESEKLEYEQGETIEATVNLSLSAMPDGVEYTITYDPAMLSNVEVEEINTFGEFLIQRHDAEVGEIRAVLLRRPEESMLSAEHLPLIKISALANRSGSAAFSFDQLAAKVAAAAGQNVLHEVVDLTVDID